MKSQNIAQHLLIGILLSLSFSFCMQILPLVLSPITSFKITIIVHTSLYIIFILTDSQIKTGRIIATPIFVVSALACYTFNFSTTLLLMICLIALFIIRVIYYRKQRLPVAIDAGLILVGIMISSQVLMLTNSWLLSAWSFFFMQAFLCYGQNDLKNHLTVESLLEKEQSKTNFQQTSLKANQLIQKLLMK